MIIQEEDYLDCEAEMLELGKEHYKEIQILDFEYEPKLIAIRQMNEAGLIFVITIRDELGKLLGYTLNTKCLHLIFNAVQAECILLYVDPTVRGATPLRLMNKTEEIAEHKGATLFSWDVPARNDFSPILERKGYQKIESCYSKHLGG